nr:hypothetical protein [Tanacetum cinerariifolium]
MTKIPKMKRLRRSRDHVVCVSSTSHGRFRILDSKVVGRYSSKWYQELRFEGSLDSRSTDVRLTSRSSFGQQGGYSVLRVLSNWFDTKFSLMFRFKLQKASRLLEACVAKTEGYSSNGLFLIWCFVQIRRSIDTRCIFVAFGFVVSKGVVVACLTQSIDSKRFFEFFDCSGSQQGFHRVHDEKRVWFEVELQGAKGDREAEVFQVSNDDTVVAQRWLEDKQPKEKTNTDYLVKEQEKEYQSGWKIKTGNVLDSCKQRSTQQCMKSGVAIHLGVAGIQQQNGLVDETNVTLFAKVPCFLIQSALSTIFWVDDTTISTYLVNRSPSSTIGFKKTIDMLRFFGWLASIKKWMLEPVKVKSIFLGYYKSIVDNKLWRLDGVTSKVVLYRNMGFNEKGDYKKTFIGSDVGTGSVHVLQGVEFEVISKWKAGLKDDMDARSDVYVLRNGCRKCSDDSDGYYWDYTPGLLDKAKGNVLGMEIVGYQSVGSQEYQMVCTRLDIASADVGMLDKFDRGLQTDVQVFVHFDHTMGRSIIVMSRSITREYDTYGGCKGGYLAKVTRNRVIIQAKESSGYCY